jgi:hypothetical protein
LIFPELNIFLNKLTTYLHKHKEAYHFGDKNIDLLKKYTLGQKLFGGFSEYGYTQLITEATHHTKTSHTLIDHIYSNTQDFLAKSGVITSGLSNHDMVFIVRKKQGPLFHTKTIRSRNFKHFNDASFSKDIQNFPWQNINAFPNDINEQVKFFESSISCILNCHAPLTTKTVRAKPSAWLCEDLKKQMRVRDHIKKQFKISKCPILYKKYQTLRNQINIACRKLKQQHFQTLFNKSNDSQHLWKTYKQLTSSTFKSTKIDEILFQGNLTKIPSEISHAIADAVVIKPENQTPLEEDTNNTLTNTPPQLESIHTHEIEKTIRSLKPKKSPGLSDIPTHIIKKFPKELSPILSLIFNNSLKLGKFPSQWKTALVTPILKPGGCKTDPFSFRPISVLPFFSKLYEHILTSRITNFCNKNKILSDAQFGFRQKHSTFHALTHLTQTIYDTLEKGQFTLILLFDLVRAFDSVSHSRLIDKLRNQYHFPEYLIVIISDYLKNRHIKIKIGSYISDSFPLFASVPQGSKLGPILWNLYINDVIELMGGHNDVYCDDIASLCTHKNFDELKKLAIKKVETLHEWCIINDMKINYKKSVFMIFKNKRTKKIPDIDSLETDIFKINRVTEYRYLGIWIDDEMKFDVHANKIINKITPRIHYLLKLKRQIPPKKFPLIFNAIVISCLEYGIQIWCGASSTIITRVQKVVDNCLKSYYLPQYYNINSLYEQFNILKLNEYANYYAAMFAKTFVNNIHEIPALLKNFVSLHESSHDTRSSSNFIVPKHKTVFFESSFKYRLIKFWNGLDNKVKNEENYESFKYLLNNYIITKRCM